MHHHNLDFVDGSDKHSCVIATTSASVMSSLFCSAPSSTSMPGDSPFLLYGLPATTLDTMLMVDSTQAALSYHGNHVSYHGRPLLINTSGSLLFPDHVNSAPVANTAGTGAVLDRRDSAVEMTPTFGVEADRFSFDMLSCFRPSSANYDSSPSVIGSDVDLNSGISSPLSPQHHLMSHFTVKPQLWEDGEDVSYGGPMEYFSSVSPQHLSAFSVVPPQDADLERGAFSAETIGAMEALFGMSHIPPLTSSSAILSSTSATVTPEVIEYDLADEETEERSYAEGAGTAVSEAHGCRMAVETTSSRYLDDDRDTDAVSMSSAAGEDLSDDDGDDEYREGPNSPAFSTLSYCSAEDSYTPPENGRTGRNNLASKRRARRQKADYSPYSSPPSQKQVRRRTSVASAAPASGSSSESTITSPLTANLLPFNVVTTTVTVGSRKRKLHHCPFAGCDKSFPRKYNLSSHVLCHTGERPHGCDQCKARFARRHDLQRHLRTLHNFDRPFKCDVCNQAFVKSELLSRHIQIGKHSSAAV